MMNCGGFPESYELSPIPRPFITSMLDNMENIDEIKILLKVFNVIYQKKGQLKYCLLSELSNEENADDVEQILNDAVKNGILINCLVKNSNIQECYYFINDKFGKKCLETLSKNNANCLDMKIEEEQNVDKTTNNIYTLYENNIGQLTPLIIEELKIAEQEYPASWINEAFKESVELNKRNWKYIKAILRNWQIKGKEDGKLTRHTETDASRYTEGKYGSRVQR